MNVELGAGAQARDGWLAVDINPRHADVVADAMNLPFADGTVDALRAVDLLEHCSWRHTDRVLAEWARVCRPGASLYVQVPDMDAILRWYVTSPTRLVRGLPDDLPQTPLAGAVWRLYGGHCDGVYVDVEDEWRYNAHNAGFSLASLRDALDQAGFDVIRCPTNPFPNLLCTATRR